MSTSDVDPGPAPAPRGRSERETVVPLKPEQAQPAPPRRGRRWPTALLAVAVLAIGAYAYGQVTARRQLELDLANLRAVLTAVHGEVAGYEDQRDAVHSRVGVLKEVLGEIEALTAPPGSAATRELEAPQGGDAVREFFGE
jgi:hypothetical protein